MHYSNKLSETNSILREYQLKTVRKGAKAYENEGKGSFQASYRAHVDFAKAIDLN